MHYARLIIRATALFALTVVVCAVLHIGLAIGGRSSSRTGRWQAVMLRRWARLAALILGLRIDASHNAPVAPFLLVSNHLSYVDVVVFASQLDCLFIAKTDVESWPVLGRLCRSFGTIFIDRRNRSDVARVNAEIARALADGRGVVLFAEGTSSEGSTVLAFRSSLLEAVARTAFPVSFAAVSYQVSEDDPPASESVCWWGEMPFLTHFSTLLRLKEIRATLRFGVDAIQDSNRKRLAERLWIAVNSEFVPVVTSTEICKAASRLKAC